jgi:hypothetical protein
MAGLWLRQPVSHAWSVGGAAIVGRLRSNAALADWLLHVGITGLNARAHALEAKGQPFGAFREADRDGSCPRIQSILAQHVCSIGIRTRDQHRIQQSGCRTTRKTVHWR